MAASRIHYDGVDRRALIRAVQDMARRLRKRVPSQRVLARQLSISQPAVAYHMRKIRAIDTEQREMGCEQDDE